MGDSDLTMECWFYNGVDTITHMVQIDVDGGATNFSLATRDAALAGDVRFLVRNDSGSSYVTISSLGDSQDFGDLISGSRYGGACGSSTRALYSNGSVWSWCKWWSKSN